MATRDREVASSTLDRRVMLLRPWERRFTIISSAWRILTSSKFRKVKIQFSAQSELWKWNLPSGSGLLVLCITPPSFSREWRIKMN